MPYELDLAALAALRPGMAAAALNAILARAQRGTVRPGKMFYGEQEGFLARVDIDGRIGSVTLAAKFPEGIAVEGLHVGMPLAVARAVRPALRHERDETYGAITVAHWAETLADGLRVQINIRDGRILSIMIEEPRTVYKRPLPAYPEGEQTPGAPFADPNLKLVVLDALLAAGGVNLGAPDDLAHHCMGEGYDRERDGYALLRPVYDYLVRYPLKPDQLAAVTSLTFDGGSEIYVYAYPFWDGEELLFDVASLEGLEHLPNLKQINIISMVADSALAQLAYGDIGRTLTARGVKIAV